MIRRFATIRRLGVGLAFVALPLVAGCGGVSQEEMAALEKQQMATLPNRRSLNYRPAGPEPDGSKEGDKECPGREAGRHSNNLDNE